MSKQAQQAVAQYFDQLLQPQQRSEPLSNVSSDGLQHKLYQAQEQLEINKKSLFFENNANQNKVNIPETVCVNTAPELENVNEQYSGLEDSLPDEFQALFCKVGSLTIAIPLLQLGGIVNRKSINQIPGMPNWHLGVQNHRGESLNIVDTYAWVTQSDDIDSERYKYLIVLEQSQWSLAAEALVETKSINKNDVKWRVQSGKRPWLAGIVKEQMCAIIYPKKLIEMCALGLTEQQTL